MTEAEHNRPIPKLFSNRPSASAAEVFGLLREPIIFFENNMWKFYWIWISYLIAILIPKLPIPRGLNIWKIKWVNMIKVQFSHGLVKNWLKLLIEEDESINKIKVRKIRKKSTIGFGFGNRPKAEFYHSLLFCFGRLWKMQLRSLPDPHFSVFYLYHKL